MRLKFEGAFLRERAPGCTEHGRHIDALAASARAAALRVPPDTRVYLVYLTAKGRWQH
jgi:hypothetical protein